MWRLMFEVQNNQTNRKINFNEVSTAIDNTKIGKAYLDIPNDVIKNDNAKKFFTSSLMHALLLGLTQLNEITATLNQYQNQIKMQETHYRIDASQYSVVSLKYIPVY